MSRAEYIISHRIREANWNERSIDFEGLSCPKVSSIVIKIPKEATPDGKPVIFTMKIERNETTGTPSQIGVRLFGRYQECINLTKYTDKEQWYLSDKLFMLNGTVAFISFPTQPKKILISTQLLSCCSPMAKLLKEKIIPSMIEEQHSTVEVVDTRFWNCMPYVREPMEEKVKEILLEHLDEICNQETSSGDG